jgi:hypothetical protein
MGCTAEENYRWFKDGLTELVKEYDGKHVVIKDRRVTGAYDSFSEAFEDTKFKEKGGEYIIQLCSTDESKTLVKFSPLSRAGFSRGA